MATDKPPKPGLRERKKIKTRAEIQKQALKLFRKQGYADTTIEQIAEAAEISPSTFFRYFPTKEAVILEDDYDPLLVQAFKEQPKEMDPVQAFRTASRLGLANMPAAGQAAFRERMEWIMSVPELRAASLNQIIETMDMVFELVAGRTRHENDELYAHSIAGALIGSVLSSWLYIKKHPEADFIQTLDQALSYLELPDDGKRSTER